MQHLKVMTQTNGATHGNTGRRLHSVSRQNSPSNGAQGTQPADRHQQHRRVWAKARTYYHAAPTAGSGYGMKVQAVSSLFLASLCRTAFCCSEHPTAYPQDTTTHPSNHHHRTL